MRAGGEGRAYTPQLASMVQVGVGRAQGAGHVLADVCVSAAVGVGGRQGAGISRQLASMVQVGSVGG